MTLSAEATSAHSAAAAIEVIPTGAALGAEVKGGDFRNLDDTAFSRVLQAWHDHSVLLVRGQTLSDQELMAFSHRYGDLDWAPIQETGRRFVEGLPEIYIVSNVKVDGEPIGSLGDGEAVWHTDMSYLDVPPKASMLYALEVPPTGGNNDGTYNSVGHARQGLAPTGIVQRLSHNTRSPTRQTCSQANSGRSTKVQSSSRNASDSASSSPTR